MLSSAPVTALAVRRPSPVLYPETDDMGENELQWFMSHLLQAQIEAWLKRRRVIAHAGGNTFLYYVKGDTARRIAPDVYVLPGIPQSKLGKVWKLWELDAPPTLAVEIVSNDKGKDYDEAPAIHAQIGTKEVVIYDPEVSPRSKARFRFQVFRQLPRRGLRRVEATQADRVRCESLGCVLRLVGRGDARRLRIGTGDGEVLLPTAEELTLLERSKRFEERRRRLEAEQRNAALIAKLAAVLAKR